MVLAQSYPITVVCQVVGYSRSSFYERQGVTLRNAAKAESVDSAKDAEFRQALQQIHNQHPTYGYRRSKVELKRTHQIVANHKRVAKTMKELGIQGERPKRKVRTTQRNPYLAAYPNLVLNLEVTYPEQVWVADITYVVLRDEFVYLAIIMDVFSRQIRAWELSRSLDQTLSLEALYKALQNHHPPQIHHSDQGVQYTCEAYIQALVENNVQVSNSEVGQAWQNGYAERLMRTIKEEEIALQDYQNFNHAYTDIKHFIEVVYSLKRIHSALGYLTPAEFEADYLTKNQAELN
jgi:transposase InsO family protein